MRYFPCGSTGLTVSRLALGMIVLATKAHDPMGRGPNSRGLSRFHILRAVEAGPW